MKKNKIRGRKWIGITIILIGSIIAAGPVLSAVAVNEKNNREIKKIENISESVRCLYEGENDKKSTEAVEEQQEAGNLYSAIDYMKLYSDLYEYNQELKNNGQVLAESTDYELFPVDLISYGLENNLFGYIYIPSIQLKLPLYLGCEQNHLKNGAAVMGNTSAPIGGAGTNSVIAAHNGWNGVKRFIKCEALNENDLIYITNFYETLCYKVTDNFVSTDDDINPVLIKEEEDMITLITCYPYTGFQTKERLIIRGKRVN